MIALALAALLYSPAGLLASNPLPAGNSHGSEPIRSNVSVLFFGSSLDDDGWGDLDSPIGIGLEYDAYRPSGLGLGWEGGLSYAIDGAGDSNLGLSEVFLGLRMTWGKALRPYIGFGTSLISESIGDDPSISIDESVFGGYVHGGVYWQPSRFKLGVDVRAVVGSAFDSGLDSDHIQGGLVLGYSL